MAFKIVFIYNVVLRLGKIKCGVLWLALCVGKTPLLFLRSVAIFWFNGESSPRLAGNVLRLCEEADFGALNCQHTTKVDAR
jgi:hypothetical protein